MRGVQTAHPRVVGVVEEMAATIETLVGASRA
jgi:hypothetical protein